MKRWSNNNKPIDWDKFKFVPIEVIALAYNAKGNIVPDRVYKAVWEHGRYYVVIADDGNSYSVIKTDFNKCNT